MGDTKRRFEENGDIMAESHSMKQDSNRLTAETLLSNSDSKVSVNFNSNLHTQRNSVFNRLSTPVCSRISQNSINGKDSIRQIHSRTEHEQISGNLDLEDSQKMTCTQDIKHESAHQNKRLIVWDIDEKESINNDPYKKTHDIHQRVIVRAKRKASVFSRLAGDLKSNNSEHSTGSLVSNTGIQISYPILHGYGDSFIGPLFLLDKSVVNIKKFKGASARGLNNPSSTLRLGEQLVTMINTSRPKYMLMMFGNVDFHTNFIYQLQSKGADALNATDFEKRVFDQYTSFIENNILKLMIVKHDQFSRGFIDKLLISSVILPVVDDKYLELCIKKYNEIECSSDVSVAETLLTVNELLTRRKSCDLETRRCMVSNFNSSLKKWCSKHTNVAYIDVNQYITDGSGRVVKQEFCDKDPTNIHILWEQTIGFWLKEFQVHGIEGIKTEHITVDLKKSAQMYAIEKHERMQNHPITSVLVKRKK